MRVLFLAPQPFFQERGTPIALKMLLEALTATSKTELQIDLLTYAEGEAVAIPGVSHLRIPSVGGLSGVRPGISLKKLLYDLIFLCSAIRLVFRSRRTAPYHLIHTVEEAVFIGWFLKILFGVPFIYDMDSSLSKQLTEKWSWLAPIRWIFEKFENMAIRSAISVIPVCGALEKQARMAGAKNITLLRDVPVGGDLIDTNLAIPLRQTYGIPDENTVGLYVGNLEFYQGIDLLLASLKELPKDTKLSVVIVGGPAEKAGKLAETIKGENIQVIFTGPQPVSSLPSLLNQADLLVSPRLIGNNTPMKIYSYLASGKAIVATNIESHTDVLATTNSILAPAEPTQFAKALLTLVEDRALRDQLGAQALIDSQRYSYSSFKEIITTLYAEIAKQLGQELKISAPSIGSTSFDLAS